MPLRDGLRESEPGVRLERRPDHHEQAPAGHERAADIAHARDGALEEHRPEAREGEVELGLEGTALRVGDHELGICDPCPPGIGTISKVDVNSTAIST